MNRYSLSEKWLERAERTIPLGSQTFSKSRTQYPVGISPLFIEKAKGSIVWDLDGNKYIDLVSSLASITLGHSHSGINRAVRSQLKKGVNFSLPGKLEAEVAENICNLVPSAEMVRFGKNGTDATSAAVRLARAFTGKDHIAVCGYHGWQDWYIGSTSRHKGVPDSVRELTHTFKFNDLQSLKNLLNSDLNFACIVLEPMNSTYPNPGFLEGVRSLASSHGAILIFDETITGFRFAEGGAQALFNVIPDLSTFGKGLANGFPLSAVVGKREIMTEMENIFFSGTFGGELLSLTAANVVLNLHLEGMVVDQLSAIGNEISLRINELIGLYRFDETLELTGHPSWKFLNWRQTNNYDVNILKTFFMQEMFNSGVLVLNTHNVNLAINSANIKSLVQAYDSTFSTMRRHIDNGTLLENLRSKPMVPLFNVR